MSHQLRYAKPQRERSGSARPRVESVQDEIRRLSLRASMLQDRILSVDARMGPHAVDNETLARMAADRTARDLPELKEALVWLDLYGDIKRFLDTCAMLLYYYERLPQNHRRALNIADLLDRMWATGVDFPFSRMGAANVETPWEASALDDTRCNMLLFTYSLFSSIYEGTTSRAVRRSCIEWLGSLATHISIMLHHVFLDSNRGRSATRGAPLPVSLLDMFEFSSWRAAALHWRGQAVRETPQHGVLYMEIANIDCDHPLDMLYWHCKSMQVARPHFDARAAAVDVAVRNAHVDTPEDLFCNIQGMLLTQKYDVDEPCARLARVLYDGEPLCESYWMRMALCCIAGVLEYGDVQAFVSVRLLAAHLVPAKDRRAPESLSGAIGALDVPVGVTPEVLPQPVAAALELMLTLIDAAAAVLDGDADIGAPSAAFLNIVFSFMHAVALRTQGNLLALQTAMRARVPWRALARVAYSLISRGGVPPKEGDVTQLAADELPEDWVLYGTSWAITGPWFFGGADVGQRAAGADAMRSCEWGYIEGNETDMFANRCTTLGRRARMRQPLQAQLNNEIHLRDVRCARLYLISSMVFSLLGENLHVGAEQMEDGAGASSAMDTDSMTTHEPLT